MQKMLNAAGWFYKQLCCYILVGMVLIVFVNTVLRYFFSSGITMSEELLRYFFVWLSFLSIIVVFKENGHLGVTVLTARLGPKAGRVLKICTNLLIVYIMYFFVDGGLINMENSATTIGQTTKIPFNWVIASSIVAGVCIAFLALVDSLRLLGQGFGKERA